MPPDTPDSAYFPSQNPRFGGGSCVIPNKCMNFIVYEVS